MKVVPRRDVGHDWDRFVEASPSGWFWHRGDWLDYQLAARPELRDESFAVVDGGVVVGVAPILVDQYGSSDFDGRPAPIRATDAVDMAAGVLASGARSMTVRSRPDLDGVGVETSVVDLSRPVPGLWADVRRSYHAVIHRAQEAYAVETTSDPSVIAECQRLHAAAAGRITRPQSTWDAMARWLDSNLAYVALAYRGTVAYGYAYVYQWKDWSYYGSGAMLAPNLGHLLLWTAIEHRSALYHMGRSPVRYFELGYLPDDPDEKAKRIQFFKEGFGGTDWACSEERIVL